MSAAVSIPTLIGSGVTTSNLHEYMTADGIIVGSHFKVDGKWDAPIDADRVKGFMMKRRELLGKR